MNNETKTHVIDGKTYVEVDRKANVGEKVIIVHAGWTCDMYKNGDVLAVEDVGENGIYSHSVATFGNSNGLIEHKEYRVLAEIGEEPSAPSNTEDLIANLVRRVASLESQLRDVQGNIERQGVEIAEVTHLAKSNEEDIRTLDERTQPKVNEITLTSRLDGSTKINAKYSGITTSELLAKILDGGWGR